MDEETKPLRNVEPEQEVIYVKENPLVKLLVGGIVLVVGIVIFLFVLGAIMGFLGHRPPTFDKDIIGDQWSKTVHKDAKSFEDCVEKGGAVAESFPPQCSFKGKTFVQSLESACASIPQDVAGSEGHPCAPESPAKAAGEKAGETFNKLKDSSSDFVKGFKEGLNSKENTK